MNDDFRTGFRRGVAGLLVAFRDEHPGEAGRLTREFDEMLDPRLRGMVLALGHECVRRGWSKPLVTCVYRTPEENAAAGAVSTTHTDMPCRAIDLRDTTDAPMIAEWINSYWGTSPQVCAYRHDAGSGMHLHLQVPRPGVVGADQKEDV